MNRRDALRLLGVGGALCLAGCAAKPQELPMPENVNGCVIDSERLAPLRHCMECCGPEHPADAWNHACIHPRTVAYSCGRVVRPGSPNEHDHEPEEIALCRRLAEEAAGLMTDLHVLGSEGGDPFLPFFVTANRGTEVPERLSPKFVREVFGGTIYPQAQVVVRPLEERGEWWGRVLNDCGFNADGTHRYPESRAHDERLVERWRGVVRWFDAQPELHGCAWVEVGENPLSETNFGCVFPRLALGLTRRGSVAGVCGPTVHT